MPIHTQHYISIETSKQLCSISTLCPSSNFPDVICVEQLSASTMMREEAQFMEILACQNELNQLRAANSPHTFVTAK